MFLYFLISSCSTFAYNCNRILFMQFHAIRLPDKLYHLLLPIQFNQHGSTYLSCMLGIFPCLCYRLLTFFSNFYFYFLYFASRVLSECQTVSFQIDQDRRSFGPDSDLNRGRLQRLSAVDKSRSGNERAEHNDARKLGLLMRPLGVCFSVNNKISKSTLEPIS